MHSSVLTALERRAIRFQSRLDAQDLSDADLIAEAIEGKGVEKSYQGEDAKIDQFNFNVEEQEIQQLLVEKAEFLKVLGWAPGSKGEGITRFIFENPNGLPARLTGNKKLDKTKTVINDLEGDFYGFSEHRNNLKHKDNKRHGINQLFDGGESLVRGVLAHNKHEKIEKYLLRRTQEGGTGAVAFGELASLINRNNTGCDDMGLARWVYMEFKGTEGHSTIALVGYVPCANNKVDSGTSFQQQRRYFMMKEGVLLCPRERFKSDLLKLLQAWKREGKRLIVMLDANEDIYDGTLGQALTNKDGLDMVEAVSHATGERLTATYFRGSKPIDGVWTTRDLEVVSAAAMPIGFGVGDHRMLVIDVTTTSLVGFQPQPIKHPKARRLNSRIPRAKQAYNKKLDSLFSRHKLVGKLAEAHQSGLTAESLQLVLDKLDDISKECMVNAEKCCQKIRNGKIPFSPEASLWIKRCQFYRSLLRFWAGKVKNKGNLKRAARRCKVANAFRLTIEEISQRLDECKKQCKYYKIHGQKYRTKHLNRRLAAAQEKGDEEAERRILEIVQWERERAFWRRLN